jgi:serine protease inhibitor
VWAIPFDKSLTAAGIFVLDDGQKKLVKMMNLSGEGLRIYHLKTELFEAVALPYGKDELRMAVLLPNGNKKVEEVLSDVNATKWGTWATRFSKQEGQVTMPRFEMEYKREDLTKELSSLGMTVAFGDGANFSRMSPDSNGLFISKVLHKTQIEVDEEGTKAAAASRVDMSKDDMEDEGFRFTVNRPFIVVIYDPASKMILFLGKVMDPPPL